MPDLRARGAGSPRRTTDRKTFAQSPLSGGHLKGHSRHQQKRNLIGYQPVWFLSRVAIIFAAFSLVYFYLFAVHHQDEFEDGSDGSVDNAVSSSAVLSGKVNLDLVKQAASKIHDKEFTELLHKLHNEKEEYRHLLKPKKSIYKKFDKNKPNTAVQDLIKKDKQGNIVYKPITSISIDDLGNLGIEGGRNAAKGVTYEEAVKGRERMVEKIHEAGVEDIDVASILSLPLWSSVSKLYGDTPVVLGLERCSEFHDEVKFPLWDASLGTAGLFNTGTNPFAMYLEQNCKLPNNKSDKAGGTR